MLLKMLWIGNISYRIDGLISVSLNEKTDNTPFSPLAF